MTDTAPANPGPKTTMITLEQPIGEGAGKISEIMIRRPMGGDFRGLTLPDIIEMKYDAVEALLIRCSTPPISMADVCSMDPADIMQCGGAIRRFFMTATELEAAESMQAQARAAVEAALGRSMT